MEEPRVLDASAALTLRVRHPRCQGANARHTPDEGTERRRTYVNLHLSTVLGASLTVQVRGAEQH